MADNQNRSVSRGLAIFALALALVMALALAWVKFKAQI